MFGRHQRRFLSSLDRASLEAAVETAQRQTTAPIRIAVLPRARGPLPRVAELAAHRLGLTHTPDGTES